MSPLAIIAIVVFVLAVIFFIGGLILTRRHTRATAGQLHDHLAAADQALEAARAVDKGWDAVALEEAARNVLQREAPGFHYDRLQLVLVDDRPGTDHDRAEFVAASSDEVVRIAVTRRGDLWAADIVG
jgi:hypothetical protein